MDQEAARVIREKVRGIMTQMEVNGGGTKTDLTMGIGIIIQIGMR